MVPSDQNGYSLPPARSTVESLKLEVESLQVIDPNVATAFADPGHGRYVDRVNSSMRNNSIHYLERIANSFPDPAKVCRSVELGNAAEVIPDKAAVHAGTIIAMSTYGRCGVQRWLLGSTADRVLHAALNPLLLLRATDQTPLSETGLFTKIVVPLDGSQLAEQTLPHVVERAKNLGLEVVLFQVFDPLSQGPMLYMKQIGEKMREEAKDYLELKVRGLEKVMD